MRIQKKMFFDSYGPPIFSAIMSCNRFTFILHNLSFDDESTHAEKWKRDRFNEIREFLKNPIISGCWS